MDVFNVIAFLYIQKFKKYFTHITNLVSQLGSQTQIYVHVR